jgi:hypothetical protein
MYIILSWTKQQRKEERIEDESKDKNMVPRNSKKQTPWPESANELYRPRDRRLSVKLVPTFADGGVSRSQRGDFPTAVILVF